MKLFYKFNEWTKLDDSIICLSLIDNTEPKTGVEDEKIDPE